MTMIREYFKQGKKWMFKCLTPILLVLPTGLSARPLSVVSGITAQYRHGQVFLTWKKVNDDDAYYRIYRSQDAITEGSQLSQCEYLGQVDSYTSKDFNLSRHDGFDDFLVIDSGQAPLTADDGLFVGTTESSGSYYYAVTTVLNAIEDNEILASQNALTVPVSEWVEEPQPVFQQTRMQDTSWVSIYTIFTSMKNDAGVPLMNKAGFIANDFSVFLNQAQEPEQRPLLIHFHAGGADFLTTSVENVDSEIVISPEDYLPDGDDLGWWGANENFNVYDSTANLMPPVSGVNYNYGQLRTTRILDWALRYLPVDSNRVYLDGTSYGSVGAFFYAITYPEKIAAVKLTVGCFNFAFEHDFNQLCTLNEDNGNRRTGNDRLGTVSTNLATNLGTPTYDLLNGGWVLHNFNMRNYPVIFAINGKYDTLMGWTEKTIFYDSVNANHTGGYYFWDSRNHAGDNATWGDWNFELFRYRKDRSFPAFANCSANENFGDGHADNGTAYGSINGFLDWNDQVSDEHAYWSAKLFTRSLKKADGSFESAPEVCSADVTPRRCQYFEPHPGDSLAWAVLHNNQPIQSGVIYYAGGAIVIPQVKIYDDTVLCEITDMNTVGIFTPATANTVDLQVFPNPGTASSLISWQMKTAGTFSFRLFNADGGLLASTAPDFAAAGTHQTPLGELLKGKELPAGTYLLELQTAGGSETARLILPE